MVRWVAACGALLATVLPYEAVAQDTRGLVAVASAREDALEPPYRRQVALVVGIDHYQDEDLDLAYAVSDADGVAKLLAERFAFDRIVVLRDAQASRAGVLQALGELADLDPEDALLVFWAGHGFSEETADGEALGYLVPWDGSMDPALALASNLSMETLSTVIGRRVPAKHKLLVVDACYSGLLTTREASSLPPVDEAYVAYASSKPVFQVLTAGKDDQTVLDGGPGGHSVFTGTFLQALEQIDGYATASEIGIAVQREVRAEAWARGRHEQTPDFGRIAGAGDFIFTPSADAATAPSAVQRRCVSDLRERIRLAEEAYVAGDDGELAARVEEARGALGCLTDAVPTREAGHLHRILGLAADRRGAIDLASAHFAAARAARPELLLPTSLVPATASARALFERALDLPPATEPASDGALVDGRPATAVPTDVPVVLQRRTAQGVTTALVVPAKVRGAPEASAEPLAEEDYLAWLRSLDAERRERERREREAQEEALRVRNAAWEVTASLAEAGGPEARVALEAFRQRFGPDQLAFDAGAWADATTRLARMHVKEGRAEEASKLRNELIALVVERRADGETGSPAQSLAEEAIVEEMEHLVQPMRSIELSGHDDLDSALLTETLPAQLKAADVLRAHVVAWGGSRERLAQASAYWAEAPLLFARLGLTIVPPATLTAADERRAYMEILREMVRPKFVAAWQVGAERVRALRELGFGSPQLDALVARAPCRGEALPACPVDANAQLALRAALTRCASVDGLVRMRLTLDGEGRHEASLRKVKLPDEARACVEEALRHASFDVDYVGPHVDAEVSFVDGAVLVDGRSEPLLPWAE